MKTNTCLAALLSALACGNAHADNPQNLIQNGDFGDTAQISGWTVSGTGTVMKFVPGIDAEENPASGSLQVSGYPGIATSRCFSVVAGTPFTYGGKFIPDGGNGGPGSSVEFHCSSFSDAQCSAGAHQLAPSINGVLGYFPGVMFSPFDSQSGTVPDNARAAQCSVTFYTGTYFGAQALDIDDIYFNSTPSSSTASSVKLGGYMSGNWYDPNNPGEGFQLEFTAQNDTLLAVWFTYEPSGGSNSPIWIVMQSTYDTTQNSVTTPAYYLHGSAFPPQFHSSNVVNDLWGTVTFTFSDCNHGTVSWNPTLVGFSPGSMAINRLTSIAGTSCPQ